MKILSIFVPGYLPPAYVGATPTPYQSGTVDKFERELAALSSAIIKAPYSRLRADPAGRFAHIELGQRYDIACDPAETTGGDALALAQATFKLEKVLAIYSEADAVDFTADEIGELQSGLHYWNAEE